MSKSKSEYKKQKQLYFKNKVNNSINAISQSHTPSGIAEAGRDLKLDIKDRYLSLGESAFIWDDSSGEFDDLFRISRKRMPEKYLYQATRMAIFPYYDNSYILPVVQGYPLNRVGEPARWHVQPIGTDDSVFTRDLQNTWFSYDNSVILDNSLHGGSDYRFIDRMTTFIVDAMLTLYQRSLAVRMPFLFTVNNKEDSRATQYMNAYMNFSPYIIQNQEGVVPQIINMDNKIDPGILDLISFWDAQILMYIGYDATDSFKRAQQSVAEVTMPQDKIEARRCEKLYCRQVACEEYNRIRGSNLKVTSLLDKFKPKPLLEEMGFKRDADELDDRTDL